jgi:hypothetical protein
MLENNSLGLVLIIICLVAVYVCYSKKTTTYNNNNKNNNNEPFIGYNYNLHSVEDVSQEYQDDYNTNKDNNVPIAPSPRTGADNASLIMKKLGLIQEIMTLKESLGQAITNNNLFVNNNLDSSYQKLKSIINNLAREKELKENGGQQESFVNSPQNTELIVEQEEEEEQNNTSNNTITSNNEHSQSQEQSKIFGGTHLSRKKGLLNELNKKYFDCDNDLLNKMLLPKKGELFIKSL